MSTTEQLFTCPTCGQTGFTAKGLKSHQGNKRCRESAKEIAAKATTPTPEVITVPKGELRRIGSIEELATLPAVTAAPDLFGRARQIVGALRSAAQGMVALQVLAGFELAALHKQHGVGRGGDRRSKPHDAALKWTDIVKAELNISADTAGRWMEMAKAVEPRLKKLGGDLRTLPLLDVPPHLMSPEQQELLGKAVAKLTDGRTQGDFMEELGLVKKPQGSGAKGGHKPAASTTVEPDEDTEQQAAIDIWMPILKGLSLEGVKEMSWVHLPDKGPVSRETLQGLLIDLGKLVRDAAPVVKGAAK